MNGLDGEYWSVENGARSRKPTITLSCESLLTPEPEKKPRKKRAPLTDAQKRSISIKMQKRKVL